MTVFPAAAAAAGCGLPAPTPLKGLAQGRQLAWYPHNVPATRQAEPEPAVDPLSLGDRQITQRSKRIPMVPH
jgi:hypothetical protein